MNTKRCTLLATLCTLALLAACASIGKMAAKPALESFDAALAGAVADIASKVQGKTGIAIVQITAPTPEISDFITDELSTLLGKSGKFTVLARGATLDAVTAEHRLQMSGVVSDKEVVGVGQHLGAKVVIAGSFSRYAGFSQLRLRAIDVRSAEIVSQYSARIQPKDKVLASIIGEMGDNALPTVTEDALAYFNKGQDFLKAEAYDEAIREFDKALAIDKNMADAYYYRGWAHRDKNDLRSAIADYTAALTIKPDHLLALNNRGNLYLYAGYHDLSIADHSAILRIKPDDLSALNNRGFTYFYKGDYDLSIADYTTALRIKPDNRDVLMNRGRTYARKGDNDRAIADYSAALKIYPEDHNALISRGIAYHDKGDYDRAIADLADALRIDPNNADTKKMLEVARKKRGY